MIYHCMDVYRRNYKIKFQFHLVRRKDQTTKNVRSSSNNSKSMHVLCKRQNIFYQKYYFIQRRFSVWGLFWNNFIFIRRKNIT